MRPQRATTKSAMKPGEGALEEATVEIKKTASKRARKVIDDLDQLPEPNQVPVADVKIKKKVTEPETMSRKTKNSNKPSEGLAADTLVLTSTNKTTEVVSRKRTKITRSGKDKATSNKEKSNHNSEPDDHGQVVPKKDVKVKKHDATEQPPSDGTAKLNGKQSICRIASWNVNGVRAWLGKGGLEFFKNGDFDVFFIQETKCSESKIPAELAKYHGYKGYFSSGSDDLPGYAGVGVLTRITPKNVTFGIDNPKFDREGRTITLEFSQFYLINVYVPNSSRGLTRLDYRMEWDKCFREYLCDLKKKKPVIVGGDFNVAHKEIDLKNPKTNERNAGFTKEERQGLTDLLNEGFVDSYRSLHTDKVAYTFWTYMRNARAKNIGWRLDYFLVSEEYFRTNVSKCSIIDEVMGSDHCPITLECLQD